MAGFFEFISEKIEIIPVGVYKDLPDSVTGLKRRH